MNVKIRIFDEYIESTYETIVKITEDYAGKVATTLKASFSMVSYNTKDGIACKVHVGILGEPKLGAGIGTVEVQASDVKHYGPIRVTIYSCDEVYYDHWKGLVGLLRHDVDPLVELPPRLRTYSTKDEPWNEIKDNGYDRLLLELWWRDFPVSRIARQLYISEGTVRNKLTILRKEYKEKIVPKRKKT